MAKAGFFDRAAVISATDKATRQVLSKFGAFVRTRAKTSIRKRKGSSPPGQPPHSHEGSLRRLIFFSYDKDAQSVVVGPTLINKPTGAPETLEKGGTAIIESRRTRQRRRVRIAKRSYMGPALEKELPGLPKMWKDSVRK